MSSNYEDRENSYGFEREYERAMPGRGGRRMQRRKICRFCMDKVDLIDFKDVKLLAGFVPAVRSSQVRIVDGLRQVV